ncbi:hypothetical protein L6452_03064 [Arctium lappa]|uniref:Uncharacterized protein n=1 Tax=Arctium lappa TaxID=4217 RepID=A0ACB9FKM3_ARCLA|nr:hypothetical protein L6452_03064 [Arctium lappa]
MAASNYVSSLRYHIVPRRLSIAELLSLPPGSNYIPTLVPGQDILIEQHRSPRSLITVGGVDVVVPASNDCPVSHNGQTFTNVRFPFRLIDTQPERCVFPGFNLRCIKPRTMLVNLPTSGEFAVRSIDYRSQRMRIYDPSNCLPVRLSKFEFGLSDSPFSVSYYRNYTLLSCPNDASLDRFTPVRCCHTPLKWKHEI